MVAPSTAFSGKHDTHQNSHDELIHVIVLTQKEQTDGQEYQRTEQGNSILSFLAQTEKG